MKLSGFYQGSKLWNDIEVRKVVINSSGTLTETDGTETLPHLPDVFFALQFLAALEKTRRNISFMKSIARQHR